MAVTDIDAAFPDVDLEPGMTITVTTGLAGALVTGLNVYGVTQTADQVEEAIAGPVLFTYGPG